MLLKPLEKLYSEFGSPFTDGVEGLRAPADDLLLCANTLSTDFDDLSRAFESGRFDDLSRIELVHYDTPGAVGIVGYVATRPCEPVFHVRSALYHAHCQGNRLADKVFELARVPSELWCSLPARLWNRYYAIVVTREAIAMGEDGMLMSLPDTITGGWISTEMLRQPIW